MLKTLCDVDFVRKKTVYDNIRAQSLDELSCIDLGMDRHGNRYVHFKQFCGPDLRIYRQKMELGEGMEVQDLIESSEGFEIREGPITNDKVFRDIWDIGDKFDKNQTPVKRRRQKKKRVGYAMILFSQLNLVLINSPRILDLFMKLSLILLFLPK